MSLLIHRAERADHLVARAGRAARRPAARPLHHRDRQRADAGGGAVVVPAAVAPAGRAAGSARRRLRRGRLLLPAAAGRPVRWPRRTPTADEDDPWRPDRVVWPLLRVIDEARGEPGPRLLWSPRLRRRRSRRRRWSDARHLAELFAGYAASRPAMIRALGRRAATSTPAGQPLGPDRRLAGRAVAPAAGRHRRPEPAERVGRAVQALRGRPGAGRPARPALGVRGHPAGPRPRDGAGGTGRARDVHLLAAAPVAGAVETVAATWRARGGRPSAPGRRPTEAAG